MGASNQTRSKRELLDRLLAEKEEKKEPVPPLLTRWKGSLELRYTDMDT